MTVLHWWFFNEKSCWGSIFHQPVSTILSCSYFLQVLDSCCHAHTIVLVQARMLHLLFVKMKLLNAEG